MCIRDRDKRVLGLASRIAGLALYEEDNYADAAWHLEKAREGSEEDAEAVRPPLMLCYETVSYTHLTLPTSDLV